MIKERLAEPSNTPSAVKKMLVFVVFAELLGYEAEFAHIHAVKLAQRGSVAEKKMGKLDVNDLNRILSCILFFNGDESEIMSKIICYSFEIFCLSVRLHGVCAASQQQ